MYLCWSIDCYNTDPGSRATYHNDCKIAFSLRPKWIRTVECGILVIKKTSVKMLQIRLYSVILKVPIKNVQEKDNCNIEQTKIMIFYVNFISWDYYLFWLTPCIFDFLFVNASRSWTDKWNIRKVKQAPNSMMETYHRLGILWWLGEGNLIFCCTGPTDSNFWEIKIIILISYIKIFLFTIYFSSNMIFFFSVSVK